MVARSSSAEGDSHIGVVADARPGKYVRIPAPGDRAQLRGGSWGKVSDQMYDCSISGVPT